MERPVALVVDRDPAVRSLVSRVFEDRGFVTLGAENITEARSRLGMQAVSLLLIDLKSVGGAAGELVEHAQRLRPRPLIVGLGQSGEGEQQDDRVRSGLFDIVPKPVERDRVERLCRRSLVQLETLSQLRRLRNDLQSREGYLDLVGRSEAMERVRARIGSLGRGNDGVWIVGEPGSGKELTARILHASGDGDGEFVLVNCAELRSVDPLFEKNGALGRADGGTLYLENLSELRLDLQEDLEREIRRREAGRGEGEPRIRYVVGSREDAATAAAEGRLLQELREMTSNATIVLPALRDRREDIAVLANYFVLAICEINHLSPIRISSEALSVLDRYDWPGNVQELRNAIEQAVILSADGTIRPGDLPERVREGGGPVKVAPAGPGLSRRPFREVKREVVDAFERAYLGELLDRHGGNVTAASRQAGMLRSALQRLLRKHGLKSAEYRASRRRVGRVSTEQPTDDWR